MCGVSFEIGEELTNALMRISYGKLPGVLVNHIHLGVREPIRKRNLQVMEPIEELIETEYANRS